MRITIDDGPATLTLKLEGRVAGLWASELRKSWDSLPSPKSRTVVVDLCGVTHVDSAGKEVLADIHKQTGAQFLADTPMTKYFAEEACCQGGKQAKGKKRGG